VVVAAPAKLTLTLRITDGPRPDGLHPIEAEMVSLDFGDELAITPRPSGSPSLVRYRGATDHVPSGDDLVTRALALAGRSAAVMVTKRIPAGAGLGGGSADAAAVLRWADFDDLERAALDLGADVAFCLVGGRARVSGIGEVVDPLPYEERVVTLLTPPVHCPTGAVYQAWDRLDDRSAPGLNDLEPAALVVRPELAHWRDELAAATGQRPQLAGSGSTWFVYGSHPGPGRVVAQTVPAPDPLLRHGAVGERGDRSPAPPVTDDEPG
jgi:4-diphosphocytidyl-2-C-methyl-D-erythritol kinase